jgi:O-antigen ligase
VGHGFGREIRAAQFRHHTLGEGHPEIRHAHNMFIDMWLQLGVAGLVALVAILALIAREYVLMLRVPAVAPWGVVGLAILAGFIAKNLTDDFLHRHNAIVFWALNGMLVGLGRRR